MRNAISDFLDEEGFAEAGVLPSARAETLDVEAFVRLANASAARGQVS